MVRPMRIRVAGGQLALSRKDGSDRRPLSRLWIADQSENEGRCNPKYRTGRPGNVHICPVSGVAQRHPLCLKYNESLPVGRTCS